MEEKSRSLIIFYRNPLLGKVKTRLAATTGAELALDIYKKLVSFTKSVVENLNVDKTIYYSDFIDNNDPWDDDRYQKALQTGLDLGEKMNNAFKKEFASGYRSVCIIGTDCCDLTADILNEAFEKLQEYDAVIGPAKDGGYYLLGMNALHPEVFMHKKWSTNTVAKHTMNDFQHLGLRCYPLQELRDVDTEGDLPAQLKFL